MAEPTPIPSVATKPTDDCGSTADAHQVHGHRKTDPAMAASRRSAEVHETTPNDMSTSTRPTKLWKYRWTRHNSTASTAQSASLGGHMYVEHSWGLYNTSETKTERAIQNGGTKRNGMKRGETA